MLHEEHDELTHGIIGCAIKVHRELGPGLLESAYEFFLAYELQKSGYSVARQVTLPITYDGVKVDLGFRPDLIVDGQVIVELKTVPKLQPIHEAQLLTYLKLSGIERGLLMNCHSQPLAQGIKRMVLTKRVG